MNKLLTITEAMEQLSCSRSSIYAAIRAGGVQRVYLAPPKGLPRIIIPHYDQPRTGGSKEEICNYSSGMGTTTARSRTPRVAQGLEELLESRLNSRKKQGLKPVRSS